MAGVLAGGRNATLSHEASADHWELTGRSRRLATVTAPSFRAPRKGHPLSLLACARG